MLFDCIIGIFILIGVNLFICFSDFDDNVRLNLKQFKEERADDFPAHVLSTIPIFYTIFPISIVKFFIFQRLLLQIIVL